MKIFGNRTMGNSLAVEQEKVSAKSEVDIQAAKIRIEQLGISFAHRGGSTEVIRDFSLEVLEQEFVTIVGPSGCGKSTLLNLLAGLLVPTSGQLLLDGEPIRGPSVDRTMVFQDDAVFPWYTVRENVEYGLKIARMPKAKRLEKVRYHLELVGLADSERLYPRELSGGMRKRVDLARALAPGPEVLLMDEPFAALDLMTKERLQKEFLDIWELSRLTVVFVTHDLEEALFLSNRVVVMAPPLGQIRRVITVPFDHPRELALKTTSEFQALRLEIARELHTM